MGCIVLLLQALHSSFFHQTVETIALSLSAMDILGAMPGDQLDALSIFTVSLYVEAISTSPVNQET